MSPSGMWGGSEDFGTCEYVCVYVFNVSTMELSPSGHLNHVVVHVHVLPLWYWLPTVVHHNTVAQGTPFPWKRETSHHLLLTRRVESTLIPLGELEHTSCSLCVVLVTPLAIHCRIEPLLCEHLTHRDRWLEKLL